MTENYLRGVASWSGYRAALAQYRIDCGTPTFNAIEARASTLRLDVTLPPGTMSPLLRGDQPISKKQWPRIDGFLRVCADCARRPQPTEEEIGQWKEVFDHLHGRAERAAGQLADPLRSDPEPDVSEIVRRTRPRWPWITAVATALAAIGALTAFLLWPETNSRPELQINGECNSVGQVLHSTSSGFTSNGSYTTEVIDPDGQPYTRSDYNPHGTANSSGVLGWQWQCDQGDKTGQYRTRVTDDSTGKSTAWVTFQVNAA